MEGLYCYGTIVRDTATWGKVKQSSDGLKHRCEMFDMTANSAAGYCSAQAVMQDRLNQASNLSPRIFHLATQEQETEEVCYKIEETQVRNLLTCSKH